MNRPKLTVSVDEARKKISLQLKRGRAIQEYNITSERDLESVNSQRLLWHDYTKNLLESMDANSVLVEKFHYLTPSISSGTDNLVAKIHEFKYNMKKDVNNLQSIYNSLDFIPNFKMGKNSNISNKRKASSRHNRA
ncbi:MAG: hypothetical protein ACT4N1_02890 [Nitrososphaerota archaeon]